MQSLESLAKSREDAWIAKHGEHEYDQHDLKAEIEEECADILNYANASTLSDDHKKLVITMTKALYEGVQSVYAMEHNDPVTALVSLMEISRLSQLLK